jgi:hypothetical protein
MSVSGYPANAYLFCRPATSTTEMMPMVYLERGPKPSETANDEGAMSMMMLSKTVELSIPNNPNRLARIAARHRAFIRAMYHHNFLICCHVSLSHLIS